MRIDPAAADPADSIETFTAPGLSQPVAIKLAADGRIWLPSSRARRPTCSLAYCRA